MIFSGLMDWLTLAAIVFLSYAVEAIAGFGATLVALTLATQFYPLEALLPALVCLNLLLSAYLVIRHRRSIDSALLWKRLLPLTALGLPVGLAFFELAQAQELKLAYGLFVLAFSLLELRRLYLRRELVRQASPLWLVLGGVVQGAYASGGPLVVHYAAKKIGDKGSFRSTLSALWLALNTALLAAYLFTGRLDGNVFKATAQLFVPLAVGIGVGESLHSRIPQVLFRAGVFSLLALAGASMTAKALQ